MCFPAHPSHTQTEIGLFVIHEKVLIEAASSLERWQQRATVLGRSSWHTFAANTDPARGVPLFMVADFHDIYARDAHGSWRITERVIAPVFRDDTLAPPRTPGAP